MGLDITAYSRLELLPPHERSDECYDDHVLAFAYDGFQQSYRGLADGDSVDAIFPGSAEKFIGGRCYTTTNNTETHGFRAGSYGGYGQWRQRLQLAFNPNRNPDEPFYELIWFADNEGTIGPDSAADLLVDFREHRDRWLAECAGDPYDFHRKVYDDWLKACELAADGGLIDFH